ncbi:Rho-binding antiterminator [Pseudomonas sp. PDM13]|uniref:Rho-binding antiterminator n=1 Tax=Pseudomonas sp. PDM13 TaxID=2769255 RepID=UPI0021E0D817|nr:Rho-binding antiterminator [Pseudomonas sp. PDM13]MCU9949975.1 Rho-binding antiterminator [Pseudomonas sp. PDM13]
MNAYQPLHCDLHDYLEIACLHGYRLRVELSDGEPFEARALTTRTAASKEEFLRFDDQREVRLDRLLAITPLDPGARFSRVLLAGAACTLPG